MSRSKEPIVWSLFAAGGMLSAMVTPVLMFVTGIAVPLGLFASDTLSYERAQHFAQNPLGKIALFVAIFLPLWHAAHRGRMALIDLGIRSAKPLFMVVFYGGAAVVTVAAAAALVAI